MAVVWTDQDRGRSFDRVDRAMAALPGTRVQPRGTHLRLTVRDKGFGYAMADHHGDGRLALTGRRGRGAPPASTAGEPGRPSVPAHPRDGRIGVRPDDVHAPDRPGVDRPRRQARESIAPRIPLREFLTDG
ncbi:hypothetical protein [Nakamurella deserti]|uniref:hypothetical protein n=1 Tax=Nakamurella deserti TaxID=2164074 RepID=UPI0013003D8D|nr:hypothetical protein [Nakamurella deserti]